MEVLRLQTLLVGMISCPQRRTERSKTIPQLQHINLPPIVFEAACNPPSQAGNKRNCERVLLAGRGQDVLLVEDDIDLGPDFPQALEAALQLGGKPVTFCLLKEAHHPPHHRRLPVGFYPVESFKHSWGGSQCLYLPREVVEQMVTAPGFGVETGQPFDAWLRTVLEGLWVALPNPVQHRSPTTLVDPSRSQQPSLTFNGRRNGPWTVSSAGPQQTLAIEQSI